MELRKEHFDGYILGVLTAADFGKDFDPTAEAQMLLEKLDGVSMYKIQKICKDENFQMSKVIKELKSMRKES